jgi:hypothetical protein
MMATGSDVTPDRGFVGREAELQTVLVAAESTRAGAPQLVWVEGEPGIGKTAFLRRVLTAAEGFRVLEGSGEESELTLEYGIVMQLLARARPQDSWAELQRRFGGPSPPTSLALGGELLELLGTLEAASPVIVAIDDAHWLDPSSAAALLFLVRRLYGDRVLTVLVSRPGGLDRLGPGWSRLLGDPARGQRITLGGLSPDEIGELAASLGGDRLSAPRVSACVSTPAGTRCMSRRCSTSSRRTG